MSGDSNLVLGLDIGVNSIGWALLQEDTDNNPCGIVDCGVRIFETAMDDDSKIMQGKAETKNSVRRQKRMLRRQLDRRKRRMAKLTHFLQNNGLLPVGEDIGEILKHL